MYNKVEAMVCTDSEINTVFTTAMAVYVPKYIYGQHLYEQENACTVKWKLWRVGIKE